MLPSSALSSDNDTTDAQDFSCVGSATPVLTASPNDFTSPSRSPCHHQSSPGPVMLDSNGPNQESRKSREMTSEVNRSTMYGGVHVQDDVVGQYLARRNAQRASIEALHAQIPRYVSEPAGYTVQGYQSEQTYDSHVCGHAQRWYPDPETFRHLYALYSLLPHISPERKLNALSGLEIDIIDGNTSHALYRGVPKKLLVLFLGREVVNKFIRTFAREDNQAWRGLPTEQKLVLPSQATSAAAIKVLVSWMKRACKFATMHSMKPLRIPNNLFVACSLARTLEMFRLHRDAYRLDVAIMQQFSSKRPIFAVEIETLWTCLGENDKYLYACIRALGQRMCNSTHSEDLRGLAERSPTLYARLICPELNEMCKPQFGRKWFGNLEGQSGGDSQAERGNTEDDTATVPPGLPLDDRSNGSGTRRRSLQVVRGLNASAPPFRPGG